MPGSYLATDQIAFLLRVAGYLENISTSLMSLSSLSLFSLRKSTKNRRDSAEKSLSTTSRSNTKALNAIHQVGALQGSSSSSAELLPHASYVNTPISEVFSDVFTPTVNTLSSESSLGESEMTRTTRNDTRESMAATRQRPGELPEILNARHCIYT